ncbi:MAG: helix-turn-helix domain-containing protein [Candidatus Desulforudis sp.]|nr:helix-turn-helix domain-containing protein [Desulforudis sp.]
MPLGEVLKKAREAKDLSLDAVEEETKIRKKYLVALENNEYEILPGRVYVKAFLRTYSRFLGLDADAMMVEFYREYPPENRETAENRPTTPVNGGGRPRYTGFLLVAGVIIALVAFNSLYGSLRGADQAPTVPPRTGIEDTQDALPGIPEPEPPQGDEPAPPEGLDLVLRVTGSACWMRVVVDGEEAFQGTVRAGESRRFQGQDRIALRLGNPGVVEVELNGENLGPLAQGGVPINHEFTVEE